MSGAVATVLIREPLSGPDRANLQGLIEAFSDHDLDKPPALNAFWVCDTRLIGGRYTGDRRPFAVETGSQPDREPGQLAGVEAFGFAPRDELVVVAFCGGAEDHRILGELSLRLAERFGGVVNFDGALWPPVPRRRGSTPTRRTGRR
jgi:hypothetical protein